MTLLLYSSGRKHYEASASVQIIVLIWDLMLYVVLSLNEQNLDQVEDEPI